MPTMLARPSHIRAASWLLAVAALVIAAPLQGVAAGLDPWLFGTKTKDLTCRCPHAEPNDLFRSCTNWPIAGCLDASTEAKKLFECNGCDCSLCDVSPGEEDGTRPSIARSASCLQPAAPTGLVGAPCEEAEAVAVDDLMEWKLTANGLCTVRCPGSMVPNVEVLACKFGELSPVSYTCIFPVHEEPPQFAPALFEFVDFDPQPGWLAGRLELDLGGKLSDLNATSVHLNIKDGTLTRQVSDLKFRARHESWERRAWTLWLPRTAIAEGAVEMRVALANDRGESASFVSGPLFDLVVMPPHPEMNSPFDVKVKQAQGSFRLSKSEGCDAVSERPVAGSVSSFQVSSSGIYCVCFCRQGSVCALDWQHTTFVGKVAVHTKRPTLLSATPLVVGSPFFLVINSSTRDYSQPYAGMGPYVHVEDCTVAAASEHLLVNATQQLPTIIGTHRESYEEGLTGIRPERWLSLLVARAPGTCDVTWTSLQCTDGEEGCFVQQAAWGQRIGTFEAEACEPPCRTCWSNRTLCTSCEDSTHYLIDGKCYANVVVAGHLLEQVISSKDVVTVSRMQFAAPSRADADWAVLSERQQTDEKKLKFRPECRVAAQIRELACNQRGVDMANLTNLMPAGIAALGTTELLIAEPTFRIDSWSVDSFITGALLILNIAKGTLEFACPTCCAADLFRPEAVRVSHTGAFWLIVDTANAAVRRIDALTKDMTLVAGNNGPNSCQDGWVIGEEWLRMKVSQDGLVEDAKNVRLCWPSDVSIHEDERRFLVVERSGCMDGNPSRVRLVDERDDKIYTIKSFSKSECPDTLHVEWVPGGSDRFVVACGRVHFFELSLTASGWKGHTFDPPSSLPLEGVTHVRAAMVPEALLFVISSSASFGDSVLRITLDRNNSDTLLAGRGTSSESDGTRQWARDTLLSNITSIAASPDGNVFLASSIRQWETWHGSVSRIIPSCPPGNGIPITFNANSADRCTPCPREFYNDGSFIECRRCEAGTGPRHEGATQCVCNPGYYKPNQDAPCRQCLADTYCTGSDALPEDCPRHTVSFNDAVLSKGFASQSSRGDSIDGNLPALRIAGYKFAGSESQCDCCFGSCSGCGASGGCQTCPEGLWCAGKLASPDSQVRVQNGFTVDWDGKSGRRFDTSIAPWETFRCAHASNCWWTPHPLLWQARSRAPCMESTNSENCKGSHCAGVQVGGQPWIEGSHCTGGRTGLACGGCLPGSFAMSPGRVCRSCGQAAASLALMSAIYLAAVCGLYVTLEKTSGPREHSAYAMLSSLGVLILLSEQLQVLKMQTDMEWPHGKLPGLVEWLLDVSIWDVLPVSGECLVGSVFAARRALVVVLPLALPLAPLALRKMQLWATSCCCCRGRGLERFVWNRDSALNLCFLSAQLLAYPTASLAMSFFQCYSHPLVSSSRKSLWYAPDVLCFERAWLLGLPLGFLGLLVPAGWLAFQFFVVRKLTPMLSKKMPSDDEAQFLARHRWLWRRIQPGMLKWEIFSQVRILMLHALFVSDSILGTQLYGVFISNLCALVMLSTSCPHVDPMVNALERATSLVLVVAGVVRMSLIKNVAVAREHIWNLHVTEIMSGFGAVVVLGFTGWVTLSACRDLLMAQRAARRDAEDVNVFAERLVDVCERLCQGEHQELPLEVQKLDSSRQHRLQRTMQVFEQVLQPPSSRKESRGRTRLCSYELRTPAMNEELEDNLQHFGRDGGQSILAQS
mmetsp:Transcript_47734/g.153651  ORF Transcript_47734/g.153651 Transcript_47734/m.153651 type:complete len:1716 (+) Transcript_47734:92-5239(+)